MNYLKSFVALAMLLGISIQLSAQEGLVLPERVFPQLDEALQHAVKQSPRMILRELDLMIAKGDLDQAKSGLYPSLGGYYQATLSNDERADRPGETLHPQKQAYDLRVTQPIYFWNARLNAARIGKLRQKIAEENYEGVYADLAAEIRAAYLRMVVTKASLVQGRYNRDVADSRLKVSADKLAKKVISDGEYAQVGIETDQDHLRAEMAEVDFDDALNSFATLTGEPKLRFEDIPDDIPAFGEASHRAVQGRLGEFLSMKEPDTRALRAFKQSAEVEDLNYKVSKKRLYPTLSFVAGMNLDQQNYTIDVAAKYSLQSQYAGFLVNWSIFDGFATRGIITSNLARKRQSEQVYRSALATIGQDAQKLATAVTVAYRQMDIYNRILESKNNFLHMQKESFVRGDVSDTEVSKAQADYNSAWVVALSARSAYLMRICDYLAITGQDPLLNKVNVRGSN